MESKNFIQTAPPAVKEAMELYRMDYPMDYRNLIAAIESYGNSRFNEALDLAAEKAKLEYTIVQDEDSEAATEDESLSNGVSVTVNKTSILKLKAK